MKDPKIVQLQTDLIILGSNPGAVDGELGSNTRGAVHDVVAKNGLKDFTGNTIPDELIYAIHSIAQRNAPLVALPPNYHDLSGQAAKEWRKTTRAWKDITGVTIHQTGCPMGENPERWLGLKAHYGVTRSGVIYRVHPEDAFGWHAQGLSHHTVGIEISGFFCGIEGDLHTKPSDGGAGWAVQSITVEQVASVKELVRYLARLCLFNGSKLTGIFPHRIATDDRTGDPGSKPWIDVARPLMTELGLTDGGPGFTLGKGQPIPDVWSGRASGIKY